MKSKILMLATCLFLTSCYSIYKPEDCARPPSQYGQCFAQKGYDPRAFDTLSSYCEKRGIHLDHAEFENSRRQKLTEICSSAESLFSLEFRSISEGSGAGSMTCAREKLQSAKFKPVAEDARDTAYAYNSYLENLREAEAAKERREKADKGGFLSGLGDRVGRTSSDEYTERAKDSLSIYKTRLAKYSKLSESTLTSKGTCTPNGIW